MKRNSKPRFLRIAEKILIMSFIFFVVGIVTLNSYESSLNIRCQKTEQEIATIESEIDGLDIKKQELASFSRVSSIAQKKGYTYKQNTVTAAVVGVPKD